MNHYEIEDWKQMMPEMVSQIELDSLSGLVMIGMSRVGSLNIRAQACV